MTNLFVKKTLLVYLMLLLSTFFFIQVSISRHHHQRPLRQRVPRRVSHSNPAIAAVGFPYKATGWNQPPLTLGIYIFPRTLGMKTKNCFTTVNSLLVNFFPPVKSMIRGCFYQSKQDPHFSICSSFHQQRTSWSLYDTNPQTNALPSGKQT